MSAYSLEALFQVLKSAFLLSPPHLHLLHKYLLIICYEVSRWPYPRRLGRKQLSPPNPQLPVPRPALTPQLLWQWSGLEVSVEEVVTMVTLPKCSVLRVSRTGVSQVTGCSATPPPQGDQERVGLESQNKPPTADQGRPREWRQPSGQQRGLQSTEEEEEALVKTPAPLLCLCSWASGSSESDFGFILFCPARGGV